jgi:hypothetical protein
MSGSLYEGHEAVVEALDEDGQQLLCNFSDIGQTIVAIAERDSEAADLCHDVYPSLLVRDADRKRYHQYRAGFVTNSAVSQPGQRAFDEAEIRDSFRDHVVESEAAQEALCGIVGHLSSGDDVTLVFGGELDERAYEAVLSDMIESRMDSTYTFSSVTV